MVSPTPNHPSHLTTLAPLPSGDVQEAATLLHQFNAESLGEGNMTAGANTLAAMALTLANIAPPGSCLIDGEDGTRIPVGMSMLVSGGLSCGLVGDRVIAPLRSIQDNLLGHIRQRLEARQKKDQRVSMALPVFGDEERTLEPPQPSLLDRLARGAYLTEQHFE